MLGLLFYGRLEKEKGFDQLILALKELNEKKIDYEIFIFGKGSLESKLLEISADNIHYFGWQSLERIKQYIGNIDYCVMPSEFLETFGLSALNALSRGLPVIGYKKGGLEPFILSDCNLFLAKGNSTKERLISIITKLSKQTNPEKIKIKAIHENQIQDILPLYTKESRLKRFEQLSGVDRTKKILIVSDFINKAGGIETYIHDVKNNLESNGYQVILRGNNLPSGVLGNFKKKIGLFYSIFNWIDAYRLKKLLDKENPDLVRFNSILRWLGPNVIKITSKWKIKNNSDCKLWMMYHDFGYFYVYPSQLFFIEDCRTPLNKKNFMKAGCGKGIISRCAILFKYLRLKYFKKILKEDIDLHLTPSDCITKIACDSYQIPEKKCKTFGHFIQE